VFCVSFLDDTIASLAGTGKALATFNALFTKSTLPEVRPSSHSQEPTSILCKSDRPGFGKSVT